MLGWLSLQVQALSHTLTREVPTLATLPTVSGTLISLSLSCSLSLTQAWYGMAWHGMAVPPAYYTPTRAVRMRHEMSWYSLYC